MDIDKFVWFLLGFYVGANIILYIVGQEETKEPKEKQSEGVS